MGEVGEEESDCERLGWEGIEEEYFLRLLALAVVVV
jgi:hypothetical protein